MERTAITTTRRAAHAAIGCAALLLCACESTTEPRIQPGPEPKAVVLEAVTPLSIAGTVAAHVTPTPVVRLRYKGGTVAPGVAVSFAVAYNGAVASSLVVTDSDGLASPGAWRLGTTAGTQLLTARAGTSSLTFAAHVSAGPIATLVAAGGNAQFGGVGATLRWPLLAKAVDAFGNPVAGAAVTFAVVAGDGAIASDTVFTDLVGVAASGPWTLGPVAGEQRVHGQSGPAQVVFSAAACEPQSCERLAYVSGGSIFVRQLHTGVIRRLTSNDRDAEPSWSSASGRIAFARYSSDWMHADILVMNDDGSELTPVTSGSGLSSPSWSPGGDALVFSEINCIYWCNIYVQSLAQGSALRPLASSADDPAWSPDGSQIVFVALSGDDGYHHLRMIRPDGTGNVEVTPVDEGSINGPEWSPDGTLIAFSKCMTGACDIYTVRPSGSELNRLTNVGNATSPAWSADGTRIAFTIWSMGVPSMVWVAAGGGTVTPLIAGAQSPAWRR